MSTFEELYQKALGLDAPSSDDQRRVEWCDEDEVLGLARQSSGGYEVFIRGSRIYPVNSLVRRHLKHDTWATEAGDNFQASRLVLPPDEHFVPVAAFLVEELLRHGAASSVSSAFRASEPLIEMALRGTALGEETVLGMLGELWLLGALLRLMRDTSGRARCLQAWCGYQRSSRDFLFDGADVEVKVTRGAHSHHAISSLGQADPRRSPEGKPLEKLFLMSIGLSAEPGPEAGEPISVPSRVEEVLGLLGPKTEPGHRNEIQELFLGMVREYGPEGSSGYDHDEMKTWPAYNGLWYLHFARAYRMEDENIQVLRLGDVERRSHVAPDSVRYSIRLPDSLPDSANPVESLRALASELVGPESVT